LNKEDSINLEEFSLLLLAAGEDFKPNLPIGVPGACTLILNSYNKLKDAEITGDEPGILSKQLFSSE
jgi:hypothetical protein